MWSLLGNQVFEGLSVPTERRPLRPGGMRSREELQREVAGTEGKRAEVGVAIELLYRAGLLTLSGELVLPTRAARYMHELTEESI